MVKIFQLDDSLSNKIAAGEVVERPASVVKELLENSIDAGGTVIEIHIEEAGLQSIRIIDNGDGIEKEDVQTAFKRHATSKIKDENDLFRIRTLGFRGEALPSIASVSYFTLKTSTGEGPGTSIELQGGEVQSIESTSSRKGTDITVSQLFFNTPARLKYMKTIHTELGNITDVVNRIALAHPFVSIKLLHNGKSLLHTNGNGDVRQVLAAIYGVGIAKKMVPIEVESLDFKVKGFISLPEVTRASRNYISTMINGRFIKNYALAKAIGEGYHTLLPIGRHPIVLLSIEMDPILVDVNVHPSKMEVRISKEAELNALVTEGIKRVFKGKELIPSGALSPKLAQPKSEQTYLNLDHAAKRQESRYGKSDSVREPSLPKEEMVKLYEPQRPLIEAEDSIVSNEEPLQRYPVEEEESREQSIQVIDEEKETPRVPTLYLVGQMHGTYIFAQNERGLYIIDQHAAQERIKYEFYKEKVGQVAKELQELLVPLTLEFSTDEYIKINESRSLLEEVGVFLEAFGYNSFIVRAHPQWFPKGEEQETIEDMIEQIIKMNKVDIKKLREEAAIMMSCKGSIKANHHLRNEDMQALLDELRRTSDPFTCPHGRPIIIHYSTYEMEKMFKRIM
ncbi:DNA mismatch repair endonuclease MutL [Rossellomorea vietnamensis]|uniref:DNA mismatch repair endonuclease MutL n=1 Tax=Rossellomorea vietnamensis TaxID=218284 RepID=UPI0005562C56|nr:DNA mismatch repair endonuclease MutL [Rossellomorea vietnamensis]OXS56061.1 DNA mismatch repair protein MutL [Bacillus sp. DSM 27956]PRX71793.1 DNA mismatch repair protein MutL [Bacillus sp. V-88]SLK24429.1 DNA mismatch repair protein MutL [Bacillus sp. V-88]